MNHDDVRSSGRSHNTTRGAPLNDHPGRDAPTDAASTDDRPTGAGSEAAEGIHDMGCHFQGERSGLDGRTTGTSFRGGAEQSASEPLGTRGWVHESGYGGKGGEPRISSDQREGSERGGAARSDAEVDARQSPFYDWLDNAAIRDLVLRSRELAPGEILVVIKGLVPGLVAAIGAAEFDAFLAEIASKAHRFQEAVDHPGDGRASRATPGESIGGPTPAGHEHLATARDPAHRGSREAERLVERELWARAERTPVAQRMCDQRVPRVAEGS